jgi:hypothetical protein
MRSQARRIRRLDNPGKRIDRAFCPVLAAWMLRSKLAA